MAYPIITKGNRQSASALSPDAVALFRANREHYWRWYPTITGRLVITSFLDDADRAFAAVEELVAKGFAQREFYGPACYGHTSYRFC